jgi:glycosyltransferase involved in cell wall biosynthesis
MRIGYLHIGPPEHGVCRYGRLLATEARRRSQLDVIEADVVLTGRGDVDRESLIQAARKLSAADAVHFQFTKFNHALWGERWTQVRHLGTFMRNCSRPLVVTLHDVFYPPYTLKEVLRRLYRRLQSLPRSPGEPTHRSPFTRNAGPRSAARPSSETFDRLSRKVIRSTWGAEATALRRVVGRSHAVLVCTQEDSRRLHDRFDVEKVSVIPHFVEERRGTIDRAAARDALGLGDVRVVTVLGFIFPFKGHDLMVEALPLLPEDVRVIFAGGAAPRYEGLVHDLARSAESHGVGGRLRITGYLSEGDLETVLMATDLAVCPFSRMSASGSMSTWISVGCPILASDLPQVDEYNEREGGAVRVFRPYTPVALAEAVRKLLTETLDGQRRAVMNLARKLSMSAIFDEHLLCYRRVAGRRT